MAYAFVQDIPINETLYSRIVDEIGSNPPPGLILHIASKTANGLRYTDVWESKEALDRFTDGRLHPAVGKAFKAMGVPFPEAEPERVALDLVHVWHPAGEQAAV